VKQLPDGIFISQDRYVKDMLTKFDMESVKTATTPYEAAKSKLKDETDPPVNVHLYRSMIGSLMYLTASRPDIMFAVSWKPYVTVICCSHGDREIHYRLAHMTVQIRLPSNSCSTSSLQVLWIQNQLLDYGFNFMNTKIFIDNQSTICIVKNPVFHQRTKHIEIRHHFIRDANEKNLIQVLKIHTDDNVADLLTKAFDGPRFEYLVVHIGMVDMVLVAAGIVYAVNTSIYAAELFDIAGWLVSATSHLVSAGSLQSCWCHNVSAE
ncbi:hypothetical protein Tco_0805185, partial [Tanacetum coccineum]